MMATRTYEEVLQEAEQLPHDQRLMLIERLAHRMRIMDNEPESAPAWEDYAASAPYPLCGEDAQEWVTRNRCESDDARVRP